MANMRTKSRNLLNEIWKIFENLSVRNKAHTKRKKAAEAAAAGCNRWHVDVNCRNFSSNIQKTMHLHLFQSQSVSTGQRLSLNSY